MFAFPLNVSGKTAVYKQNLFTFAAPLLAAKYNSDENHFIVVDANRYEADTSHFIAYTKKKDMLTL